MVDRIERFRLGDGMTHPSVDVGAADEQYFCLRCLFVRGFEQVQGPAEVHPVEPFHVAASRACQAREVVDLIRTGFRDSSPNPFAVGHVQTYLLAFLRQSSLRTMNASHHLVALLQKVLDQVGPRKPGRAGDKCSGHVYLISAVSRPCRASNAARLRSASTMRETRSLKVVLGT